MYMYIATAESHTLSGFSVHFNCLFNIFKWVFEAISNNFCPLRSATSKLKGVAPDSEVHNLHGGGGAQQ